MDANFGLVRKRSAGTDVSLSRMGDKFFMPQEDVDLFLKKYDSTPQNKEISVSVKKVLF